MRLAALASFWWLLKHRAKQEPTEGLNPLKEGSSIAMYDIQKWGEGVGLDFSPPQSGSGPKLTQQSFKAISVYKAWRLGAYSNRRDIHNKSNDGVTAVISVCSSGRWTIFSAQKHQTCNLRSLQPYDLLVHKPATMAYFHKLRLKLL